MKSLFTVFFCLLFFFSFSQNQHEGLVVDKETKEPLEFVSIYNSTDHTISNADGRYAFSSTQDSVIFYRVGYDKLETSFSQLRDTMFLSKSVFELNEVVVTNAKTLLQKVRDSVAKNNSFKPYKEKFLLRAVAKKDDSIWRIQDIQGKLQRKTLFYSKEIQPSKKDYEVEITNMRKIGAISDENHTYLKLPPFRQIFNGFITINIQDSLYDKSESYFDHGKKIKLEFSSKKDSKNRRSSGYYIINASNYAIETYYHKGIYMDLPFKKNWVIKYRDTFYEIFVVFKQHPENEKYYISSAKSTNKVEVTNEKKSFHVVYEVSTILTTSDNFGEFDVTKNISSKKELFNLKYPYDPDYWQTQNQLLLTNEMQEFITKMGQENNEFKVRSNMD